MIKIINKVICNSEHGKNNFYLFQICHTMRGWFLWR